MLNESAGYDLPIYDYASPPEMRGERRERYSVVIVGGGLAGLTIACDLASRGIEATLIDEDDTVGVRGASSRGICYAQKSLEIFDRLGIYERIKDKGVTWSVGKVLRDWEQLYTFDLALDSQSNQPPFINIQQFYIEWFLVDRIQELGRTNLRWKSRLVGAKHTKDGALLTIETPEGRYDLEADWVVDATGAASPIRDDLGLAPKAEYGEDRWCISDVRFKKELPTERWTWVAAEFNEGRAVWQHLMADGVWRIDYQMSPNADPAEVSRPDVVEARLRRHLGEDTEFELVWVGPYAYRTQLMDEFRSGRFFFIGDAAHVKSPFGARGGNSGIQDAENLAWKLALVLKNEASESLLETFNEERRPAAVENIKVTGRSGRFLAPASEMERRLRDAVLDLSPEFPFARLLLNTGRMCAAHRYSTSSLTVNGDGENLPNIDLDTGPLVHVLKGVPQFLCIWREDAAKPNLEIELDNMQARLPLLRLYKATLEDAAKLDLNRPGDLLIVRPDMHVLARLDPTQLNSLEAALGKLAAVKELEDA